MRCGSPGSTGSDRTIHEGSVEDTLDGRSSPVAFLRHLPATSDEALGSLAFAPGRRVPVAQDVAAAVQGEEGVHVRVVEGTQ
jgi:hypothetical protein